MKRILPAMLALLAASSAMAAAPTTTHSLTGAVPANPVKVAELPAIFKNEPAYIQNQICGELMASMTRLSADLYEATGQASSREAAILTGMRGVLFVKATASLSDDERTRARNVAEKLENGGSMKQPTILPFRYCEERIQRWVKEGVVTKADVAWAEKETRAVVDKKYPLKTK